MFIIVEFIFYTEKISKSKQVNDGRNKMHHSSASAASQSHRLPSNFNRKTKNEAKKKNDRKLCKHIKRIHSKCKRNVFKPTTTEKKHAVR